MTQPKTLTYEEQGYKNLVSAASMLEAFSKHGYRYTVEDIYFDFGLNWMYTAIVTHDRTKTGMLSSWQTLDPKQWEQIVEAESVEDLAEAVDAVRKGDYFHD